MGLGPKRHQLSAPASVTPRPGAAEYWVSCHIPQLLTFCLGSSGGSLGSTTSSDHSLSTHLPQSPQGHTNVTSPRQSRPRASMWVAQVALSQLENPEPAQTTQTDSQRGSQEPETRAEDGHLMMGSFWNGATL